jgi:23S rRNA (adenine2503-C2)-methyltransferase
MPALVDLLTLSFAEMGSFLAALGWPRYRTAQVLRWLYQRGVTDLDAMTNLSKRDRAQLAECAAICSLNATESRRAEDGTLKFIFSLAEGTSIETVVIPDQERLTLCLSTQVGCTLDCAFCLTGRMGLLRNLQPQEIVGQVLAVQRYLSNLAITPARPGPARTGPFPPAPAHHCTRPPWIGQDRPSAPGAAISPTLPKSAKTDIFPQGTGPFSPGALTNLVLMGMGEPLANPEAVEESIRRITDRRWGLGFSPRRITLSTAGLAPRLNRVADLGINLAVSLNATTEAQRNRLMPAANHAYSLKTLLDACRRYPLKPRQRLTFEYVLLKNENDSEDDALRLARLVRNIRCKINLIPFNEFPGSPFQRPSEDAILRFQSIVTGRGLDVFIRKSKGREVLGACGQLGSLSPPLVRPLHKQAKRGSPAPALASASR